MEFLPLRATFLASTAIHGPAGTIEISTTEKISGGQPSWHATTLLDLSLMVPVKRLTERVIFYPGLVVQALENTPTRIRSGLYNACALYALLLLVVPLFVLIYF